MNILESSIKQAGSVGKLAAELGVAQNVVSNWRSRGTPKSWQQVLQLKFSDVPSKPAASKTGSGAKKTI
ncbi:MAG: hypothetical protein WCN21_05235 [Comamonadaceae bacterium]